jgi:hypothetical protein
MWDVPPLVQLIWSQNEWLAGITSRSVTAPGEPPSVGLAPSVPPSWVGTVEHRWFTQPHVDCGTTHAMLQMGAGPGVGRGSVFAAQVPPQQGPGRNTQSLSVLQEPGAGAASVPASVQTP